MLVWWVYTGGFTPDKLVGPYGILFVCLFLWTPSFEGNWVSLMGFSLMSGAGVNGNNPYQAQELQITTLANPGI